MTRKVRVRRDFLEEMIEESTREDRRFPAMLAAAYEQLVLGERLAARRRRLGLTQTEVARRMGSTQRIVSKIETGGDVNVSTLRRCTSVLGLDLRVAVNNRRSAFLLAGK